MKQVQLMVTACTFGLILLAMAQCALAADGLDDFRYDIELEIPPDQHKLMEDHLELYRWRGNERMNADQLERLVRMAPQQIRELLATEGADRAIGRA